MLIRARISGDTVIRSTMAVVLGWSALAAVVAVTSFIRFRLLNCPLERDEGEFAYAAQLLMHGLSPYQHAYNAMLKLPGTCVSYAISMMLFGQTASGIRAGVIIVCASTALLIFIIARRICGHGGAAVAAATYGLLSISPVMQGLAAHASHFIILPALAGAGLLQNVNAAARPSRLFLGGILLGLATMMKQSGVAFAGFGATWIIWNAIRSTDRSWRELAWQLAWLSGGLALVGLILGATLFASGDLNHFWFWSVEYAGAHGAVISLYSAMQSMVDGVSDQLRAAPWLWLGALAGGVLLFVRLELRRSRAFALLFLFWSLLAVCPGWYFRGHYFLQLVPAIALLCGIAVAAGISALRESKVAVGIIIAAVVAIEGQALFKWKRIYFELPPDQVSRALYGDNPFPEAMMVGRFLAAVCPENSSIAVIGSEPEIYFYSQRRSASGYICVYPLTEEQRYAPEMRTQMIREVEQSTPSYVVFVNVATSWAQTPAPPDESIFVWFERYQREHLRLVGATEVLPNRDVVFWKFDGHEKKPILPTSYSLAVFQSLDAVK